MAAVNAHQLRGPRDVGLSFVKFSLNELAVVGISGFLKRWKPKRRRWRFFFSVWRQVADCYCDARIHDYNSFDRIPQLSNVSRPVIVLQLFDSFRREFPRCLSIRSGKMLIEIRDQQRHIFQTLAQWRQFEWNNIEPIEQIGSELSLLHLYIQAFIGGCDYS